MGKKLTEKGYAFHFSNIPLKYSNFKEKETVFFVSSTVMYCTIQVQSGKKLVSDSTNFFYVFEDFHSCFRCI